MSRLGPTLRSFVGDEMSLQTLLCRRTCAVFTLVASLFFASSISAHAQVGDVTNVHDPCIIRDGKNFYLYSTGQGIQIRQSEDLFHWKAIGRVFDPEPAWAVARVRKLKGLWAPDIVKLGDRFYLFYSVSTFGTNDSSIGAASTKTLDPDSADYAWKDHGELIRSEPGKNNWNAIDPQVAFDERRQAQLIFGSFLGGIQIAPLELPQRTPIRSASVTSLAARPDNHAVEAAFVYRHAKQFYLFCSWDFCCKGVSSNYRIVVGRSDSLHGPFRDHKGTELIRGGGTPVLAGYDRWRGPGHCAVIEHLGRDWLVHHAYDRELNGSPTLQIRPIVWDSDGWPLVGEPISEPPLEGGRVAKSSGVVGSWHHFVSGGPEFDLDIHEGGRLGDEMSKATWRLANNRLTLRFPSKKAPGGAFVNQCVVDPSGQWYAARDPSGALVRGIRKTSK